jgi:competence protein ComEC
MVLPVAADTLWTGPPPVPYSGDSLTVEFLDVGQADAILITMPHGGRYLIDAGVRPEQALELLRARGIERLDGMLLTHPHTDHCGGMPAILRAITVDTFYESGKLHTAPAYRDTLRAALEREVGYATVKQGDTLAWDPDVLIEVLWPDTPAYRDINTNSVVLRLTYRGQRVLLTGDATKQSEQSMLTSLPPDSFRAEVLKVAHHGSRGSSMVEFLVAVAPQMYVIQCGRGNSYGHPAPQAMERITAQGGEVYRTDTDGTVTLHIYGDNWSIAGETSGRKYIFLPVPVVSVTDSVATSD